MQEPALIHWPSLSTLHFTKLSSSVQQTRKMPKQVKQWAWDPRWGLSTHTGSQLEKGFSIQGSADLSKQMQNQGEITEIERKSGWKHEGFTLDGNSCERQEPTLTGNMGVTAWGAWVLFSLRMCGECGSVSRWTNRKMTRQCAPMRQVVTINKVVIFFEESDK